MQRTDLIMLSYLSQTDVFLSPGSALLDTGQGGSRNSGSDSSAAGKTGMLFQRLMCIDI